MAGYVFGLGFLVFAAWHWWRHRVPSGATVLTGTVTAEVSRKSTQTGRKRRSYGPVATYHHPATGRQEVFQPEWFGSDRYDVGDPVRLVYDPGRDRVFRPPRHPAKEATVLVLVGLGFILAQVFGG